MGGRVGARDANASLLGRQLREGRERMGWNLRQASAATAIPVAYLDAIEGGHLELLPGPVYARGYVRTYASALHLDGDAFTYAFTRLQPQGRFDTLGAPPPGPSRRRSASDRPSTGVPKRWVRFLGIGFLALLGLLVLNAVWAAIGPDAVDDTELDGPARRPADDSTTASGPPPPPSTPPAPAAGPLPAASSDSEGAVYAVGRDSFAVTLEPTGRVWVRARQGPEGEVLFEGTLGPGENKTLPPMGQVWLRVGNQANLRVLVDGAPLSLPGGSDEPYNIQVQP